MCSRLGTGYQYHQKEVKTGGWVWWSQVALLGPYSFDYRSSWPTCLSERLNQWAFLSKTVIAIGRVGKNLMYLPKAIFQAVFQFGDSIDMEGLVSCNQREKI